MIVTIEYDEGNELRHYAGRKARVHKEIGAFSVVEIEGVGFRGCLTQYLQPVMTAETVASRFSQT